MTVTMPQREPAALPRIEAHAEPSAARPPRLVSLDVFRGITIAAMLLVNNPGKGGAYPALIHAGEQGAGWNGWTPTDLIFPFFLFIVGVAIPFSFAKRIASGNESRGQLLAHVWARALSLFMLGELLTGFPYVAMEAVPEGFNGLKIVRYLAWGLCGVGILLLLTPWRSRKLSLLLPVVIAVLFYALACGISVVNARAIEAGLPRNFRFGNGLLRPENLRIPGVLQRIGICYGVAASIALFVGWRMIAVAAVAFMAIYTALMFKAPFPGHQTGSLSKEDNLARKIDEWLLIRYQHDADGNVVMRHGEPVTRWNHAYGEYPDNEGLLSTLPAIATVLIGILAGVWLRTFRSTAERCSGLLVFGLLTLLAGMALNRWLMPINKEIWTPSFTVFTAGMAMLVLGACFYFVDVLGRRRWAFPFVVYGMNAIAAYVAAGIVVRVLAMIRIVPPGAEKPVALSAFCRDWAAASVGQLDKLLENSALAGWTINTGHNQSLAYALLFVLAIFVLMCVLYVCRIFVKV
jgi:predicted acyltransferase